MALVVAGFPNKQVGDELGISEITVKAHRAKVMRKMDADSLPALVCMAAMLGLARPRHRSGSPGGRAHLQRSTLPLQCYTSSTDS